MALGQLAAVGAMQQRQVRVKRRLRPPAEACRERGFQHQQLLGRVGEVVLAAHHVRDAGVQVVDRDREVVEHRAVRARDHGVVEMQVLEAGLAADQVVHDRRALLGDAQAHRSARLRIAPEAALGSVAALVGLHVLGGGVAVVGVARVQQRLERLLVAAAALALKDRPLVPVELQPAQGIDDLGDVLGARAVAIGVLDAQHELSSLVAREQPVEQCRPRPADVQRAGRRGGEAHPHRVRPFMRQHTGVVGVCSGVSEPNLARSGPHG